MSDKTLRRFASVVGSLFQVVPTAYIIITDGVPSWARWILGVWLVLWALITVAEAST